jgi:biopolymer transport protein ExbD
MSMAVGDRDENEPMMDMNTTPLIDVMLVLLIMFIITIPVQTHAVKIDLPVPTDSQSNVDPEKNKVMIDPAGTITWNGSPVDLAQLAQYLEQTKALPVEPELQVQPDPYARYIVVDNVMAVIKRSGVGKLGFVGNEQYGRGAIRGPFFALGRFRPNGR